MRTKSSSGISRHSRTSERDATGQQRVREREARDLEILDRVAVEFNREMDEALEHQVSMP